jgi:cell division septation protein DedD
VAQDFAKKRGTGKKSAVRQARNRAAAEQHRSATGGWRAFFAGLLTGALLSFIVWLGTLPPAGMDGGAPGTGAPEAGTPETRQAAAAPPRPRFDFYTVLPEQTIPVEPAPAPVERAPPAETARRQQAAAELYLLQAGAFRQREDADRRRAELLLLGLEPSVEEGTSDNGRWFRVILGPYEQHAEMNRARSLAAAQGIETQPRRRSRYR